MKVKKFLYRWRGELPTVFIILILIFSKTNELSLLVGIIFLFTGQLLRYWSIGYDVNYNTRRSRTLHTDFLFTSGPYAYVRNPIYLGNFFIGLSYCVISNLWWSGIIFFPLFYLHYNQIIILEEKYLREKFKEKYDDYYKNVPCFIPQLTSYSAEKNKFSIKAIIFSKEYQTVVQHIVIICAFLFKDKIL